MRRDEILSPYFFVDGATSGIDTFPLKSTAVEVNVVTDGVTYAFEYSHYLNDTLKTIQYPTGKVITYDVDPAGRVTKVFLGANVKTYADILATQPAYEPVAGCPN